MFQLEEKIIDRVLRSRNVVFFLIVSGMGLISRYCFRYFISIDMNGFLIPWFYRIQEAGGVAALAEQVGDYNIMYQFLIGLFSYLPVEPQYLYKGLSIVFDYLLAFACGFLAAELKGTKPFGFWFNAAYGAALMLPTVVENSAMWGQCDSIYTCFLVLTLYFLIRKQDVTAFILYGVAIVFKLQAIFLLPFLVIYYLYARRFSILMFAIPVAVLWLSGIPAYFYGRPLTEPFTLYANQAGYYWQMWMNTASFWQLVGNDYAYLYRYSTMFTFLLLGLALYAQLEGWLKIDTPERVLSVACWCIWTCVLFLPSMHERYTYPVDLLFLILVLIDRKYLKFALVEYSTSLISYSAYLFGMEEVNALWSFAALAAWLWFTVDVMMKDVRNQVSGIR